MEALIRLNTLDSKSIDALTLAKKSNKMAYLVAEALRHFVNTSTGQKLLASIEQNISADKPKKRKSPAQVTTTTEKVAEKAEKVNEKTTTPITPPVRRNIDSFLK